MAKKYNQWKPFVTVNRKQREFPTYRLLVKNMKILLEESSDNEVTVSRSKRGEWGEWFEVWRKSGGVIEIVKQGWN